MICGIFGGTFDPPHVGHLIIGEHVRESLHLEKVIFVPAAIPPHKTTATITDGAKRLEMLHLAVGKNPFFEVDDQELRRGGVSYTVDTLTELSRKRPGDSWVLLIGRDNLPEFRTWKEPERILRFAQVVVMTRPGHEDENSREVPDGMIICRVPEIGISSSEVRARVREGRSIRYLVPSSVEKYITAHLLYR